MKNSSLSPDILFASANASAHFALHCLEPTSDGNLRATSSFVDPEGEVMLWHDFGPLEGPGWAANAVGGAHLLYRWGSYLGDTGIQEQALRLVDHVLNDGFIQPDGLILPYWHTVDRRFCLNYTHNDDWLCPGSLAKIGVQMLELARDLSARNAVLTRTAHRLADWLVDHVPLLDSGWTPRRITVEGTAYPLSPHGEPDPIYDHSADGLFLLWLWAMTGKLDLAQTLGDAFVNAGGMWGSINHDTFDDHENVAYACAFRILRQVAGLLDRPEWRDFAYEVALPAMQRYRMDDNRNGVFTQGLFWMEESWDTAYLWENAEVAQTHLEAWLERDDESYRDVALGVLSAIARHHYGTRGFLTEGVDWNNHVGQQHHIRQEEFGAIRYTEPLLNNLHHIEATLTYLNAIGYTPPSDLDFKASIEVVCRLPGAQCAISHEEESSTPNLHKVTLISREDQVGCVASADSKLILQKEFTMPKDLITFLDFSSADLIALLDLADTLCEAWQAKRLPQNLAGKSIALIWDAEGFRNRVAFELGIAAMGGIAVQVPGKLDERESIEDVARYLDNWFDGIVSRARKHEHMLRLAAVAEHPVINARTDFNHPCEILGDLAYIRAQRGRLEGLKVAFVGEATNLCHPWFEAAARLPIHVVQICPAGYEVNADFIAQVQREAVGTVRVSQDLNAGLQDADVVYTDCWPHRSSPEDHARIARQFRPYQITAEKLWLAAPDVLFLPCPPVTRGEEVSEDAMAYLGHHVYEAKAYLLHAQNAVLTALV